MTAVYWVWRRELAVMLRATCSRVTWTCSAPERRSNSPQSTRSSFGSRPNHPATPTARPRSVIACSATTWKLAPIAAGRDSARSKACATSSACTWCSTPRPRSGRASGCPVASPPCTAFPGGSQFGYCH